MQSHGLQNALRVLYPPQCLTCEAQITTDFALCGPCWRDTPFIVGLQCDKCGLPLPGDAPSDGSVVQCDDCLTLARPWDRGRAALLYRDNARKLVLSLKHADRIDLARPAAAWMARAAAPILAEGMLVAPIPLHWVRLFKRKYNQSALLAEQVARLAGLDHCPDLLLRVRNSPSQEGRDRDGRFANLSGALRPHPRRAARMQGRAVLLVDDVMTSGATLAAGAEACLAAGAASVSVLALARVAKDS